MIDTLFFALQIVGILVLIGWAVLNDRLKQGMPTRGPLAFKQDDAAAGRGSRYRKRGVGLTRHRREANLEKRRR